MNGRYFSELELNLCESLKHLLRRGELKFKDIVDERENLIDN